MSEIFFSPQGIAVIGASRDPHKLGYGVIRNLVEHRYKGAIYPVNKRAGEILGIPCYPSVNELPDPVDLAVIIVPAPAVPDVIESCGKRRIRHAIVVSGGFSETGQEGKILEKKLLDMAGKHNMRIIGPNCIGTIDTHTPVNTTFVTGMPEPGGIGFISQSGAMVAAVIDWARGAGAGFSRIVSLGNQADVHEIEMIRSVKNDPHTQVITAYIEGVSDGAAFMKEARDAALEKPFVILKGGHGKSGSKAVASHTGALAGSTEAYRAAFRRSGIQEAATMEEMFDLARAMAWQPLPEGDRVAVLTNAGGPAILAVDAIENAGLKMAPLTDKTREYLSARLPVAASVNNPVDLLAGSGPATYTLALEALLTDETVDSVVVIQAPQDWFLPASLAEVVGEVAGAHNKPVITSIMGKASVDEALAILHKRRVPNVAFPERSASVLAAMSGRRKWLETTSEKHAGAIQNESININRDAAEKAVTDRDWPGLLEIYGIRLPKQFQAKSAEEAVQAAGSIAGRVVMKLESDKISHKSDVGGVHIGLKTDMEINEAWKQIESVVGNNGTEMNGVLIQQMIEGGQEVIVGIRQDDQFGPLLLFGSGGVDVELYKDVETSIAPLNRRQAEQLVDATKAGIKLNGWRGLPPGDREAVLDTIVRMGQLAADFPEIGELEINPLIVRRSGEGVYAVDVRGGSVPAL